MAGGLLTNFAGFLTSTTRRQKPTRFGRAAQMELDGAPVGVQQARAMAFADHNRMLESLLPISTPQFGR